MDLREQLQATLATMYTLERELGGGGMSRVFVADETRLGRKVVVKVLSPELAAGMSAERFEREINSASYTKRRASDKRRCRTTHALSSSGRMPMLSFSRASPR